MSGRREPGGLEGKLQGEVQGLGALGAGCYGTSV